MTQKSSDVPPPPNTSLRASGPEGQLARTDFTPERIAAYSQLAAQFGDAQFLSEEAREQSRIEVMKQYVAGTDLWVFGYGSLMWNPAIHVDESLPGKVEGFHRSFCMRLMFGRAMPDNPGLMLCLVPGGSCYGIAHRIAPEHVESESKILWMREMLSGAYIPTWVTIDLGAHRVSGVTFVINTDHPRYLPDLSHDEKASRIAKAEGYLGTNRDYLFRTVAALESAGVKDAYIEDLHTRVRALTDKTEGNTMKTIKYSEIEKYVGQEIGASEWVKIDQDRVNKFADATGDHQWIHIDVERAKKELPTGGTIAHGYLTLSLIPWLGAQIMKIDGVTRGINYGSNKVRFTNMVPVGSRVRARMKLLNVDAKAGGKQITSEYTIEVEGQERPACVAETIGIMYG